MKNLKLCVAAILFISAASCGQTNQQDNTTRSADTMVMKPDQTDTATNTISTDTTKK